MDKIIVLESPRLLLRRFYPSDAKMVQTLAGDDAVSSMSLNIPHPYEDGVAENWIGAIQKGFDDGTEYIFAITERQSYKLLGSVSLTLDRAHKHAQLGYWVGKIYWGQGFVTEAATEALRFAFTRLGLHRVYACHFTMNPASGRVLTKLGMRHEGKFIDHYHHRGKFEDVEFYGILAETFLQNANLDKAFDSPSVNSPKE